MAMTSFYGFIIASMALVNDIVEQVGRSVVVPKTPLLPNNSLNPTRLHLQRCATLL